MSTSATCQCGTVQFTVPMEPLRVYICHCIECQRQSASAFGISAIFPAESVLPHLEALAVWERPTNSGNTLRCYFCRTCGVRLVHHGILKSGEPKGTVSVKGGCIKNLSLKDPEHIWTRSALVPFPEGSAETEPVE